MFFGRGIIPVFRFNIYADIIYKIKLAVILNATCFVLGIKDAFIEHRRVLENNTRKGIWEFVIFVIVQSYPSRSLFFKL